MATPGALAHIAPDDLIERVRNGEIPSRIAAELGVTKAAVYYHLAERPDWVKARRVGMAVRLDDAETGIVDSRDQLTLSRAREAFRAVAWRAEREHPETWGNSTRLTGGEGGGLPAGIQVVFVATQPAPQEIDVTPDGS